MFVRDQMCMAAPARREAKQEAELKQQAVPLASGTDAAAEVALA